MSVAVTLAQLEEHNDFTKSKSNGNSNTKPDPGLSETSQKRGGIENVRQSSPLPRPTSRLSLAFSQTFPTLLTKHQH